jgi:hypothetical protein
MPVARDAIGQCACREGDAGKAMGIGETDPLLRIGQVLDAPAASWHRLRYSMRRWIDGALVRLTGIRSTIAAPLADPS